MATTQELDALIERVAKAGGNSRLIDAQLAIVLGQVPGGGKQAYVGYAGAFQVPGTPELWMVPYYTESIDDALGLMAKVLPGWTYLLDSEAALAQIYHPEWPNGLCANATHGSSMALAVVLATLRALNGDDGV